MVLAGSTLRQALAAWGELRARSHRTARALAPQTGCRGPVCGARFNDSRCRQIRRAASWMVGPVSPLPTKPTTRPPLSPSSTTMCSFSAVHHRGRAASPSPTSRLWTPISTPTGRKGRKGRKEGRREGCRSTRRDRTRLSPVVLGWWPPRSLPATGLPRGRGEKRAARQLFLTSFDGGEVVFPGEETVGPALVGDGLVG